MRYYISLGPEVMIGFQGICSRSSGIRSHVPSIHEFTCSRIGQVLCILRTSHLRHLYLPAFLLRSLLQHPMSLVNQLLQQTVSVENSTTLG